METTTREGNAPQRPPAEASGAALLEIVTGLIRESRPAGLAGAQASLDSSLQRDLGIDSLARVELLLRIEQAFAVRLPQHSAASAETPRDLLRALLAGPDRGTEALAETPIVQPSVGEGSAPDAATTLAEVLDWHVAVHPDRTHILLLDESECAEPMTYAELRGESSRVAAGLAAVGVGAGHAVAIMLPTSRDFFRAFMGILLAGAVPVPIYPPARLAGIEDHLRRQSAILANCGATLLITVPEARAVAVALRADVPSLDRVVTVAELAPPEWKAAFPVLRSQDLALLQYTSGSTGNPKGVMLTHGNLLANIRAMRKAIGASAEDVFVSWLPLYHDMGLIGGWLGGLYCAYPLVVMSPTAFLARPSRWLRAIHSYRGTLSAGPNFAYEICATRVDEQDLAGLDLSSWRLAFNGAEPVGPGTVRRFVERFARHGFRREAMAPVYGLAECGLGVAFPPLGRGAQIDHVDRRELARSGRACPASADDANALPLVGCGSALPGYEIRVVGPDKRELAERTEGRIEIRGPSVTSGYFRNAEATRALFAGDWLDTGDVGYFAGGELFLTSRAKDIIIRGGQHLFPHELESAVGNIPGVRRGCVAVFGFPDPGSGSEKVAVLAETRLEAGAAHDALRAEIAQAALRILGAPADDIVLAAPHTVLKTSSGKIRRAASRELYERGLVHARPPALWQQKVGFVAAIVRGQGRSVVRTLAQAAYSAYLWSLAALLSVPALGLVLWPHGPSRVRAIRALARALVRASGLPLVVTGLENLPERGPAVIVANHASYIDGVILFAILPPGVRFVAKGEMASRPGVGRALRAIGVRFVDRFDAERGAEDTRSFARAAAGGEVLVFFPEGTLTRAPGLLPFHMGAFVVSAAAHASLVPVVIRGTRSVLRDGSWMLRHAAIHVDVGVPIEPAGEGWSSAVKLRDCARARILAACGEPDLARIPA